MRIIGPASALAHKVHDQVALRPGVNRLFLDDMFNAIWFAAEAHDLDPVPLIAQSGHETAWGTFTRAVKASQHNPAGIKVNDPKLVPGITDVDTNTLAHYSFVSWEHGARVYAQHVCLYAGWFKHLADYMELNPRRRFVESKGYKLENWEQFGNGAWNTSPTYGTTIVAIARELQGAA
jgi:hypothetical protein